MAVTVSGHRAGSPRECLTDLILCPTSARTLSIFLSGVQAMKVGRITLSAMALVGAVAAVNCGDYSPSAPSNTPDSAVVAAGLLGSLTGGLLSCPSLPAATTSKVIGTGGGTISVGPHTLTIPAGALSASKTIKAVIKSEKAVRVHFEPDGLQFAKPATLTMSYQHCGLLSVLKLRRIVYVKSNLSVLETLLSLDNVLTKKVSTQLQHFSDYAVEEYSFSDHVINWGGGTSR
jgi:hypothetical protein